MKVARLPALATALAVSGCATIAPELGHAEVDRLVEQRIGGRTAWDRGAPTDEAIAGRVANLLDGGLTRERAVAIALVNNPSLQATYEELGVSQADLVQAGLLSNPTLSASLGFPAGGGRKAYGASLVQSFLDVFVLPLRKRVAREQFTADTLRVAHDALGVAADTSAQFAAVQATVQTVELDRLMLEAERAAADLAERRFRAGNITDLELAMARTEYEQARLELAQAELRLSEQREALNQLLGLWGTQTGWELAERLPGLPPEEAPLDGLERMAIRQRLDVDAARKQVLLMSNAVDLARSARFFGLVEVGVEVEQDTDGPRVFGPTLSLELPLFDRRQALVARLEAQRRQSERRLLALSVEVRSHVRLARARLVAARQRVEHYRTTLLPLHESVVAQTQLQYNAMQLGLGELLRARRAQLAARRAYLDEVRGYWAERAELERVTGGRLDPPAAGPEPDIDQTPKAPEPEPSAPAENHEHHTS